MMEQTVKQTEKQAERQTAEGTNFASLSCKEFCRVLASREPVPGGGGASALAGALAAALGNMVGNLTVGKKKYAAVEAEIIACNERAEKLRERFLQLIEDDAACFAPLAAVYRLPGATAEEKEEKAARLEEALLEACRVPAQIMECCLEALELIAVYEEKGSVMALSDAAAAALLAGSALTAASSNIRINARSMADRHKAEEITACMEERIQKGTARADEIYRRAVARLS